MERTAYDAVSERAFEPTAPVRYASGQADAAYNPNAEDPADPGSTTYVLQAASGPTRNAGLIGRFHDAHPPSLRGLLDFSEGRDPAKDSQLVIHVKTGDHKDSGTDALVSIKLGDGQGRWSHQIKLTKFGKNTHERGREDTFNVAKTAWPYEEIAEPEVVKIELWRDNFGFGAAWYVDVVSVENLMSGKWHHFPIHRWIKANVHYVFQLNDCVLPQYDEYQQQRDDEMKEKKLTYQYEQKKPGAPVQVKNLPDDENFGVVYSVTLALDALRYTIVPPTFVGGSSEERWTSLSALDHLYKLSMPVPDSKANWNTDEWFGQQRLQGCNPVLIRQLLGHLPNMPVDEKTVVPILGSSLETAIAHKRIFVVDHSIFDKLPNVLDNREISAPIALFYLDEARKHLRPLAIQLNQVPGPNNPIFYPTDEPNAWLIAKMWFNNADSNYHQAVTHLGFTHLMMESVSVCVNRNLSRSHPIFKLLAPHFLYLQAINAAALAELVSPGGWVDKTLVIGASGLFELIGRASEKWRLDVNATPPTDFRVRGVDDPAILPNYPYRDDASRIYKAIRTYVKIIVNAHYHSANDISGDHELQSFARELVLPKTEGGIGLRGVPIRDGKFNTIGEIVTTCAAIISTCSMTHAAVNFNQYDEYGFPPNYPTRMSDKLPTTKTGYTEADIAKQIPNKKVSLDIMAITRVLSSKGTNSLGDFEVQYSYDPTSLMALRQLKHDLEGLSIAIAERNASPNVHLPYPWLDPEIIPNAISI